MQELNRPSRREFLAASAATTSALTAGLSLSRSAHAAGSERFSVILVGAGGRGTGAAADYYLDAADSKYCVGIHRCTVRDYQPWNPQYHRRGLLKADDTPYPILVDYTRRTNEGVYELLYQRRK